MRSERTMNRARIAWGIAWGTHWKYGVVLAEIHEYSSRSNESREKEVKS